MDLHPCVAWHRSYAVMCVVGYAESPGRLWRLVARPSDSEANSARCSQSCPVRLGALSLTVAGRARNAALAR